MFSLFVSQEVQFIMAINNMRSLSLPSSFPLSALVSSSLTPVPHFHQQTIITYDKSARPFRVERVFKFYRKLAIDLSERGVNVGTIGNDEDTPTPEPTRRRSGAKTATGELVELYLPPFPESFVISSFGMKLTESQLQQRFLQSDSQLLLTLCLFSRCQKLHDWMRELLCCYHILPADCQSLIAHFLLLDEDETIDTLILHRSLTALPLPLAALT
jgi:hypothetical protein